MAEIQQFAISGSVVDVRGRAYYGTREAAFLGFLEGCNEDGTLIFVPASATIETKGNVTTITERREAVLLQRPISPMGNHAAYPQVCSACGACYGRGFAIGDTCGFCGAVWTATAPWTGLPK